MSKDEAKEPKSGPPLSPSWLADSKWPALLARYEVWLVLLLSTAILVPGIWSFTLIDPWETHYGEVARRMLADGDWVNLHWQNEDFNSKPVLTFWLMALGMKATGVASGGGYSGELTASGAAIFAIRIPFLLFGIFGLVSMWSMLSKLVSRRVAWLALLVLGTTPFYFLVARQGITDMPMVACLMGSVSCFAMAIHSGEEPLKPIWGRVNGFHVFQAVLGLFVVTQLVYYMFYFGDGRPLAQGLKLPSPTLVLHVPFALLFVAFVMWVNWLSPTTKKRQVYMYWLYLLAGISVLGKGPPAIAIIGGVCLFYFVITGHWRLLLKIEFFKGAVIACLVALPWHFAIFLMQGRQWINHYWDTHILARFFRGVHGDRGSFDYYAAQLSIGMWPWIALVPAALAAILIARRHDTRDYRVRLLIGSWAIFGFAMFAVAQTKFHHYTLPVVPALAILVAFYLDDLLAGRAKMSSVFAIFAAGIVLVICRDLMGEQKQLIELFIYRHDRPWPAGEPWNVDISGTFLIFGLLFAGLFLALAWQRGRRITMALLALCSLVFAIWTMNSYMGTAAPHWGQRELHRSYYKQRQIHGVDIRYYSLRDLSDEWSTGSRVRDSYRFKTVLSEGTKVGDEMYVRLAVPGAGIPNDRVDLPAKVSKLGDDEITLQVFPDSRGMLRALIERGKNERASKRRPERMVNADRLVAWMLNWRGENFWSGGEIYGPWPRTQTVFMKQDNAFVNYLRDYGVDGQRYFIITESHRAKGFSGVLKNPKSRTSVRTLDTSNNKFTLLSFVHHALDPKSKAEKNPVPRQRAPIAPTPPKPTGQAPASQRAPGSQKAPAPTQP